jgi:hypothetical protein
VISGSGKRAHHTFHYFADWSLKTSHTTCHKAWTLQCPLFRASCECWHLVVRGREEGRGQESESPTPSKQQYCFCCCSRPHGKNERFGVIWGQQVPAWMHCGYTCWVRVPNLSWVVLAVRTLLSHAKLWVVRKSQKLIWWVLVGNPKHQWMRNFAC